MSVRNRGETFFLQRIVNQIDSVFTRPFNFNLRFEYYLHPVLICLFYALLNTIKVIWFSFGPFTNYQITIRDSFPNFFLSLSSFALSLFNFPAGKSPPVRVG